MLVNRFDNLSIDDLIQRSTDGRAEVEAVEAALKARMISECPVEPDKVYRFRDDVTNSYGKPSYLRGKKFLAGYVVVEQPRFRRDTWRITIQGFLSNPRSTTGDGFNRKVHTLNGWDKLVLASAEDGPRSYSKRGV